VVILYTLVGSILAIMLAAGLATLIGTGIPIVHHCEVEGRFNHATQSLWDVISDVATHAQWRKLVKDVHVEQANTIFRISYVANPTDTRLRVTQAEEPHRLVWSGQDMDGPVQSVWTLSLQTEDNCCRLHIQEESTISHPWYRFVFKYITGYDKMLKDFLEDLENRLRPADT